MSIKIIKERCIGCKLCTNVCPGNLIEMNGNKAEIIEKRDCWDCSACLKKCPKDAIEMYLLDDLGSENITLRAVDSDDEILWSVRKDNVLLEEIKVSKKESNIF